MSRLERENPLPKVTPERKARLAAVDSEIDAKIAERRVFLESRIAQAAPPEAEELRAELAREIARLEEQREDRKEKIRRGGD